MDPVNIDANGCSDDDGTLMVHSGDSRKPALKLTMDCLENEVLRRTPEAGNDQEEGKDDQLSPPIRRIVEGGCGNKILSVTRHYQKLSERLEEQYSAATGCCSELFPGDSSSSSPKMMVGSISIAPPGSSSWDTAAPSAVLLAADPEARITDLLGRPLIYDGEHLLNEYGIVVSSGCVASRIHRRLCNGLYKDREFCNVIGVARASSDDAVSAAGSATEA